MCINYKYTNVQWQLIRTNAPIMSNKHCNTWLLTINGSYQNIIAKTLPDTVKYICSIFFLLFPYMNSSVKEEGSMLRSETGRRRQRQQLLCPCRRLFVVMLEPTNGPFHISAEFTERDVALAANRSRIYTLIYVSDDHNYFHRRLLRRMFVFFLLLHTSAV